MTQIEFLDQFDALHKQPVIDFFDELGLPLPDAGQFYVANDKERKLVFLSDYGLVLRLMPQSHALDFANPHFLKPLFTRHSQGVELGIDPGVNCALSHDQGRRILSHLVEAFPSVHFGDDNYTNMALLPCSDPAFPVAIDLDAHLIRLKSGARSSASQQAELFGYAADSLDPYSRTGLQKRSLKGDVNPQDLVYGDLQQMAQDAFGGAVISGKLKRGFFKACAAAHKDGRLLSPWESRNYAGSGACAASYQKRPEVRGLV